MKKVAIAVSALFIAISAHATGNGFNVNGGFSSATQVSGGSMAEAGGSGNFSAGQYATSTGYGLSIGGTGMAAGYSVGGNFGAATGGSISGAYGTSGSYAGATGYTTGNGYGDAKAGAGVDYSAGGYSGMSGSYSY